MMRRLWNRLAVWCAQMVFALCCALDGDDGAPEDEIVETPPACGTRIAPPGWWCSRGAGHDGPCAAWQGIPPDPAPAIPACVATALRYYEQQLDRLSEARRDWALMSVGQKIGDVAAAQRAVRHYERLVDAARDRLDEELATAEAH